MRVTGAHTIGLAIMREAKLRGGFVPEWAPLKYSRTGLVHVPGSHCLLHPGCVVCWKSSPPWIRPLPATIVTVVLIQRENGTMHSLSESLRASCFPFFFFMSDVPARIWKRGLHRDISLLISINFYGEAMLEDWQWLRRSRRERDL